MSTVIDLTRELICHRTELGGEEPLARLIGGRLEAAGFAVQLVSLAPGRLSLVATFAGGGALTLSGHLDVVPATGTWRSAPFEGVIADGRIHGRGSSDMKGGLAAMLVAAAEHARRATRGFALAITAGEESGCLGAATVSDALPPDRILVIGEATDNQLHYGHKGCTWVSVETHGISAHASRPDLGRNAIDELAEVLTTAHGAFPTTTHPELGMATLNVGTVQGGTQANLVPDLARAELDVRTVPGFPLSEFERSLAAVAPHSSITRVLDLPSVWTDPDDDVSCTLRGIVESVTGRSMPPAGTAYFTDAGVLATPAGRAYIVGPGDPNAPHTVDESCSVQRIEEAQAIYGRMLEAWEARELTPETNRE